MDRRCYCRKHPSHMQSKGVCPFCLRERLSNITSSSSSSTTNLSNSSTTSLSPISSELGDVFAINKEDEREKEPLKKSRSLAFVMEEEEEKDKKKNNKKRKFWSKFLVKRKEEGDDKELMHSKTMKEKPSTKWVVFSS